MTKEPKRNNVWPVIAGFAVILAIVLGVLQIDPYLERKIESALRNPKVIQEIASQVRPAIVFDSRGSIIADLGGMQFIRQIKVESKKPPIPDKVVVTPKEFMASPPILTPIDRIECIFKTSRGAGLDWEYSLDFVLDQWGDFGKDHPNRFRLEIIR